KGVAELTVYLVINKQPSKPSQRAFDKQAIGLRVRSDFNGNTQDIGGALPHLARKAFFIKESFSKNKAITCKLYRITLPLDATKMHAQDLAFLVFDRVAPYIDGKPCAEWADDIHLVNVAFHYKKLIGSNNY